MEGNDCGPIFSVIPPV